MNSLISLFLVALVGSALLVNKAYASKQIPETPYCSRMELIDSAQLWTEDSSGKQVKADRIVVSKSRKKLYLLSEGRLLKEYSVSFGFGYKDGAKERRGDGRTPEGLYEINLKKTQTSYYLALQVSYPNKLDLQYAAGKGLDPGSDILIHGFPSRPVDGLVPELVKNLHGYRDWTQGCIAVTNQEMSEIFDLVETKIPLEICSLSQ